MPGSMLIYWRVYWINLSNFGTWGIAWFFLCFRLLENAGMMVTNRRIKYTHSGHSWNLQFWISTDFLSSYWNHSDFGSASLRKHRIIKVSLWTWTRGCYWSSKMATDRPWLEAPKKNKAPLTREPDLLRIDPVRICWATHKNLQKERDKGNGG